MRKQLYPWLAAALAGLLSTAVAGGQTAGPAAPTSTTRQSAVAAVVNGETIPEVAVQRALKGMPPEKHAEARSEILNILIDNALIERYLVGLPVTVDMKAVDAKMTQIRDEIKKEGSTFEKVMQDLMLTETELREKILAELRWERFAEAQVTDKSLRDLFAQNREMFDGTLVSARHILLSPPPGDAAANEQAKARLLAFKKQIEGEVAQGLAKLPPQTDKLAREKARYKLTDDAFAAIAAKESACPSKADGGNLRYFPRAGTMIDSFARVAFSLQPYQMSGVVTTQFGHHLILTTDRKPGGKEVKFEDVQNQVKEVFFERLRDRLTSQLRPTAKITINPPPKT